MKPDSLAEEGMALIHKAVFARGCARQGMGILLNAITNIVGRINHRSWQQMAEHVGKPCGKPGCTCHLDMPRLWDALDEARTNFRAANNLDTTRK